MLEEIAKRFQRLAPAVDFWSLRLVDRCQERITVRRSVLEPIDSLSSLGAHITVLDGQGMAYAATCDLSDAGLAAAAQKAVDWAKASAGSSLLSPDEFAQPKESGQWRSYAQVLWDDWPLQDKIDLLKLCNDRLKLDDQICDWSATLHHRTDRLLLVTPDSEITQEFSCFTPGLNAVANQGTETQRRSFGYDNGVQAGLEYLAEIEFLQQADRVAEQSLALLHAEDCPSGTMPLLLLPEQMMLQIHESIGHPLELDRILGDERNYAGTSFVTLDMFGSYRYGSEVLNVVFDPGRPKQLASYGYDDEGTPAKREYLIRGGILQRPLGGLTSQRRAGIHGVANARSCDWNRPPIDRMANINLEPGNSTLEELIESIEYGVLMDTNLSWSIDDSRNKFQFGCEYGRLIENGELKQVVRNPNYRGISATFWRNLVGVGDVATGKLMGTPTCGKGEPNQGIHVGHASPACVFKDVDVFGGGG